MLAALLKALPDNFLDENDLSIAFQECLPIELHACAMIEVMTVPSSYLAPSLDAHLSMIQGVAFCDGISRCRD
jgi:hypothetical protein